MALGDAGCTRASCRHPAAPAAVASALHACHCPARGSTNFLHPTTYTPQLVRPGLLRIWRQQRGGHRIQRQRAAAQVPAGNGRRLVLGVRRCRLHRLLGAAGLWAGHGQAQDPAGRRQQAGELGAVPLMRCTELCTVRLAFTACSPPASLLKCGCSLPCSAYQRVLQASRTASR